MEEAGLLADALRQLDEPFLVVVVGEFNSGKSTVRNWQHLMHRRAGPCMRAMGLMRWAFDIWARRV